VSSTSSTSSTGMRKAAGGVTSGGGIGGADGSMAGTATGAAAGVGTAAGSPTGDPGGEGTGRGAEPAPHGNGSSTRVSLGLRRAETLGRTKPHSPQKMSVGASSAPHCTHRSGSGASTATGALSRVDRPQAPQNSAPAGRAAPQVLQSTADPSIIA
jgi:hypothetical protein